MRSSSFRQGPAALLEAPQQTKKKKINWDRVFYLSLLGSLVLSGLWYVARDVLYMEGTGRVVTGRFDVRFSSDIKLLGMLMEEGAWVDAETPLFRFVMADDIERAASRQSASYNIWLDDRLRMLERVDLKRIEKRKTEHLLAAARARAERIQRGVYLDLYTAAELDEAQQRIETLRISVEALGREVEALETSVYRVDILQSEEGSAGYEALTQIYWAPVAGTVDAIYWEEAETVVASERVLSIALNDPGKLYIRAVFTPEEVDHLHEGDEVRITHANGEKSSGQVRRLMTPEVETDGLADPFENNLKAFVLADIYPMSPADRVQWHRLKAIGLKASKWRF